MCCSACISAGYLAKMLRFEACCKKKWPSNGILYSNVWVRKFMTSMSRLNSIFVLFGIKIYSSNFIYFHDSTSPKSYLIFSHVFFTCPSNFIWSPSARRWLVRIIWKGSLEHKSNQNWTMYIPMITTLIKRVTYTSSKTEVWTLWHITVKKGRHHGKSRKNSTTNILGHSSRFFTATSHQRRQSWANPKEEKTKWNSSLWSCNRKWIRYFQTSSCQLLIKNKNSSIDVRAPLC